ncbi:MAG: threonylcarbamoyl-AMP synthase [Endomicrobium sp.]|uniref:L-threonylcarbamoyladenylate synthase n=1 Tax=Candidatus Endomicrobiellum pyrsonymphae TaxID=1408203 RepID=UPI00357C757C|nr:threonylcarbamoyl-AMP synthase [Endomicrobium sp.]
MTLKISEKDDNSYKKTAEIIKTGGIAIVPTETVYGFAVDAFNMEAQKKIYKIKKRSLKKPLILMATNIDSVKLLVEIPKKALAIAKRFWPGQLTLIFPTTELGKIVSGGRNDIGARIPNSEFMLNLLKEVDRPIFTTSVNVSNKKSAKNINETVEFNGIVDVIVDGGQCKFSLESTVVNMVQFPYVIIRKGCLNTDELLKYV